MEKAGYHEFLQNLPYGIILIADSGVIMSVNNAAEKILCRPASWFTGSNIWDKNLGFSDRERTEYDKAGHPFTLAVKSGSDVLRIVMRFDSPEGCGSRWLESNFSVYCPGKQGDQCAVIMSFHEITEILKIEERYKTIFENSPFALALNDTKTGKYIDVNNEFLRIRNISKEYCVGKTPLELGYITDPHRDSHLKEILRKEGSIRQYEFLSPAINGRDYVFLMWVTLIEVLGELSYITVLQDITERKKAERELLESEERYRKSREQLRSLAAYLQNVREEERIRIAREIHDDLGHLLTVIKLDLDELSKIPSTGNEKLVRTKAGSLIDTVNSAIGSVRKISTELRPAVLDHFGLIAALEWLLRQFESHSRIRTHVSFCCDAVTLDSEKSSALFRIFQEILTNVARHSGAKDVFVSMHKDNGELRFTVADNGSGFTVESASEKRSLGLIGMQERALMIGAIFSLNSTPGKGTEIIITLPEQA